MTEQIKPNDELKSCLKQSKTNGQNRAVKILLENGKLVTSDTIVTNGKWDDDHGHLVSKLIIESESSIVLIRLDTKNKSGLFEWLMVLWCGANSTLGDQVDSVLASLQKEMSNTIKTHFIATKLDELKLESCIAHLNSMPLNSITNNNKQPSNGTADKNGAEEDNDDGGDEEENVSKTSKKKKNKKKKSGAVNSDGVQNGPSCPSKSTSSSASKSKQTDPPTIPISLLFPSSNYPVGQIMDHPNVDGSVIHLFSLIHLSFYSLSIVQLSVPRRSSA